MSNAWIDIDMLTIWWSLHHKSKGVEGSPKTQFEEKSEKDGGCVSSFYDA